MISNCFFHIFMNLFVFIIDSVVYSPRERIPQVITFIKTWITRHSTKLFPVDEYTGMLLTYTNNSKKILQNKKSFLGISNVHWDRGKLFDEKSHDTVQEWLARAGAAICLLEVETNLSSGMNTIWSGGSQISRVDSQSSTLDKLPCSILDCSTPHDIKILMPTAVPASRKTVTRGAQGSG